MPEDLKQDQAADTGADSSDTGEDQTASTDQNSNDDAADTGADEAGKGEDDAGGANQGSKDAKKDAKAPKEDSSKDDADDGSEPPVKPRLSKADFVLGRKLAKAKKQEAKQDDQGDEGDDGEQVDATDEETIVNVVAKRFGPVIEKTIAADDNAEVAEFLSKNPDFKPFEATVRRYMDHPSRRQLPVASIFYEVAGPKLMQIGATRARAADAKAKQTQTGGGSNRGEEGEKGVKDLSDTEFRAKQEEVRRGKR